MMKAKLAAFLMLACGSYTLKAQDLSKPYTINGNLKGLKTTNGYVYLRGRIGGKFTTDSVKTTDGHFLFSGNSEPTMVMIFTPRIGHLHRIDPIQLFLDGDNIQVTGKYDTLSNSYFSDVKITGSASQEEYEHFNAASENYIYGSQEKVKELEATYKAATAANDTAKINAMRKGFTADYKKGLEFLFTYVKEHPKSFVSLFLVGQMSQSKGEGLAQAKQLFMQLDPSLQFSTNGKKISDNLAFASRGEIMNKAAGDFAQPTIDGRIVKLSDYRGKYVLLDFWASWCGPCRAENPNVLKCYNKFKNKGFDVLAVSLDGDASKWKKAVDEDHLPWTQVSDLKISKNAAVQQFGVSGIPDNFLIDPNGIVIARGLRGEDLEKKLAELLK